MKRFLCALVALSTSVLAQLPNGEPAGAIPISLGINPDAPAGISGNVFTNVGEPSTLAAGLPATCTGSNTDVFFSFTAPNSALYVFQTCTPSGFTAGTLTDTVLQVLDAAGTVALGCNDDSCSALSAVNVSLTAGTPVLVRVADFSATTINTGTFYVTVTEVVPPANDVCGTAQVVTDGVLINGTTLGAGPTNPNPAGCTLFTTTTLDVWYSYTPATSGTVRLIRTGTGATRTAVYTGSCGAEVAVVSACNANLTNVFDVVAGTPYLIRAGTSATSGAAFTLFIEPPVAPTVSSDTCAGAQPLVVGVNAGNSVGATPSNPSPVCTSFTTTNPDQWFTFTSAVDCAASIARSADGEGASRLAVYTTPDCATFTAVNAICSTSSGPFAWTALAGVTYYVRTGVASSSTAGPYLLFVTCVPFEPNDSCAGALAITEGVNGPYNNNGTLTGNDVGFNTPCGVGGNVGGRDLFYTYTPACDGVVTMTTCGGNNVNEPGALSDTQLVVYDNWTCGAGPNAPAVACNDDAGGSLCGVSGFESTVSFTAFAGTTYLVRVAGFSGNVGTFNLTVTLSTAQFAVIGTGCGVPNPATLGVSGAPVMGSTGTITVTAQPQANGLLLFSNRNTAMVYTPFGACTIYLENPGMGALLPIFTDATGQWALTVTYPTDPALDCVGWDFQGLVIGAAGIELTNALRLILGT